MISYCDFEKRKETGRDAVTVMTNGCAAPSGATQICDPRKNPPLVGPLVTVDSEAKADSLLTTSQTFSPRLPEGLLPAGPSFFLIGNN